MVYASVPAYLDPPNWNQQHQIHQAGGSSTGGGGGTGGSDAHQLLIPPVPPARPGGDQNMSGSARPGSMADRARLAKVPQPEPSLKCPRCDSSNTKFCYFNNYSLSQPRHFCKTCRRYWTRGGALRNVPVGGGCRRNKRSKSSGSKSSTSNSHTTGSSVSGTTSTSAGAIGPQISAPTQYPFLPSLNPLSGYGSTNIGLSYGGLQTINDPVDHYQVGGNSSGGAGLDQWRFQQLQHFPFFAGLEQQTSAPPSLGLYSFDTDVNVQGTAAFGGGEDHGKATAAGLISQLASVKMEESQQCLNRSTQYLGITAGGNDHQYWANSGGGGGSSTAGGGIGNSNTGNGGWTMDLSGFNSSSAGNLL